ncbi:MAG TPA: winged helix DNA-binding domain-containing protein [Acidimicrobiales bacterium]|nr:winged helix DNA-binding domain-containing protein [Acidimicrobiales bacterium]
MLTRFTRDDPPPQMIRALNAKDWVVERRLYGLLLRGQALTSPAGVVGQMTAVQAQDHPQARWSVAQRMAGTPDAAAVDTAFADGRFVRVHMLRPTWHYVAATDLRWLMCLSGPRVDAANARQYEAEGLGPRPLARSNEIVGQAVASGPRTRRELAVAIENGGVSTAGLRLTLILMHAELTGVVCSGPMQGKQHTYAAFDDRAGPEPGPRGDEALGQLAWRYFSTRGPATVRDFSWWSGLNARDARLGLELARSRLIGRELDGRMYWCTEQELPPTKKPGVDLVQCYDEMIISYSESRDIVQTTHTGFPFLSRSGGFSNVVLLDGKLLGHWRRASRGSSVEVRTDKVLGARQQAALAEAIGRYRHFAP